MNPGYKRILIKLSGEMLGEKKGGFSASMATRAAGEIRQIIDKGVEVALLVGGGNIMRARDSDGVDRLSADFMGLTATVINAIGLKSILKSSGVGASLLSAVNVEGITEELIVEKADDYLKNSRVVIFAGGTGSPYFTTDTGAVLRALEIKADILLKATKVDGVYDSDPEKNSKAKLLKGKIPYGEVIKKNLKIMDRAALSLVEENGLPVNVFNFLKSGNLKKVVEGEAVGTTIC